MMNPDDPGSEEIARRRLREEALRRLKRARPDLADLSVRDTASLLHELDVHQTELEVQNEELRRSQAELAETRDRYLDLYEWAPVGYLTLDRAGRIVRANLTAAGLLGREREKLLGERIEMLAVPEDRDAIYLCLRDAEGTREKQSCEPRLWGPGDSVLWALVEIAAEVGTDPEGISGYRMTLTDVTVRKGVQRTLEVQEERLRLAVEGGMIGLWDRDLDTEKTTWNDGLYDMLGRSRDAPITGSTFFEYIHEGDRPRVRRHTEEWLASGGEFRDEFRTLREDGQERWLVSVSRVYRGSEGGSLRAAGAVFDITERKQAEDALRGMNQTLEERVRERTAELEASAAALKKEVEQRKKNEKSLEALSERRRFLSLKLVDLLERDRRNIGNALHDQIGQILTTIKMDLESLKKMPSSEMGDTIQSMQDRIVGSMKYVRNIAHSLRPDVLDHVGLVPSIRSLARTVERRSDCKVNLFVKKVPERLSPESELALYRIVQESLTNTVKHSGATTVYITLIGKGDTVVASIEDDGIGFDCERMSRDRDGGPLGLIVMKERAALISGELWVESAPGKGTHVVAEIPVNHAVAGSRSEVETGKSVDRRAS